MTDAAGELGAFVFVPDLAGILVFRRVEGSLHLFDALPNLDRDARFRRIAFKRRHFLPGGKETSSGALSAACAFGANSLVYASTSVIWISAMR
jgi:hypothetical protein